MSGKLFAVVMSAVLCVAAPLCAQQDLPPSAQQAPSVADAARAARANKHKAKRVYTNEDMPESPQENASAPSAAFSNAAPGGGEPGMVNHQLAAQSNVAELSGEAARIFAPPRASRAKLIVFLDLECPASRTAALESIPSFVRSNPVELVRVDWPLTIHEWALRAAAWALYFDDHRSQAREDFRTWALRNQDSLSLSNLDASVVKNFPHEGELDARMALDSDGPYMARAAEGREIAAAVHAHGTPHYYVVCASDDGVLRRDVKGLTEAARFVRQCAAPPPEH